jgi:hypothetical protein
MTRSTQAAGTRAAQPALQPARESQFDRFLLADDTDDFTGEIRTLLRESFPRGREVLS